jgi:hypothetical protein
MNALGRIRLSRDALLVRRPSAYQHTVPAATSVSKTNRPFVTSRHLAGLVARKEDPLFLDTNPLAARSTRTTIHHFQNEKYYIFDACREFSTNNTSASTKTFATIFNSTDGTNNSNIASNSFVSFLKEHEAVITDLKKQVQACALQGDAVQAQETLEQLETLLATAGGWEHRADIDAILLECREAVLDTWIVHQASLVQEVEHLLTTTNTTTLTNSEVDPQTQKQAIQLCQQVFQAAENAHGALEKTIPFLKQPALAIYTKSAPKSSSSKKPSEADDTDEPAVVLGSTTTAMTRNKNHFPAMSKRCNAVIKAWARAAHVWIYLPLNVQQDLQPHGIPQRSMFLLQRMQASANNSSGSNHAAGGGVRPTTESYNRVLEAWACSQEHLRGTMAEQLFQSMQRKRDKHIKPNGTTYRWIVEAWVRSKQRKSAFTATGHLMKWLRRLELAARRGTRSKKQNDDNDADQYGIMMEEPSLELYHLMMEAWTHAE